MQEREGSMTDPAVTIAFFASAGLFFIGFMAILDVILDWRFRRRVRRNYRAWGGRL
jgi:hypothetical protein